MKPLDVLVERGGNAQPVAAKLRSVLGVVGATAPPTWHRGPNSLVEAFPATDDATPGIQAIIDRAHGVVNGTGGTLTGRRRGRPRLPARPIRQLPLRVRPRHDPDPDPGVPLDRAGDQGGAAEPGVLPNQGCCLNQGCY
jgi:hypothetical protein